MSSRACAPQQGSHHHKKPTQQGRVASAAAATAAKSLQSHRRQSTRLPCPWDSPGKNTGVGCHFLLQCMKVKSESEVAQLCPTLSDPMDCSPPGSSVHGMLQARGLEWGAIAFSEPLLAAIKESLHPTTKTQCSAQHFSYVWLLQPYGLQPARLSHVIFLARILEWVAIPFCRRSSPPRDQTHISCIAGGFFTIEPPGAQSRPSAAKNK